MKPVIGISLGDPGGVGPEIISRTFSSGIISKRAYYLIIGTPEPFTLLKANKIFRRPLFPVQSTNQPLRAGVLNFLDVSSEARAILSGIHGKWGKGFVKGRVAAVNAAVAMASLKTAADLAACGMIDAIVTAPLNKTAMRLLAPKFYGHTEYLAETSNTSRYAMMFVSQKLKVTLVSIHIPLSKVSRYVTRNRVLEKISLTHDFLKNRLKVAKPKIAVCALNPHGKETGVEDEKEIRPAVYAAQKMKIDAAGPFSADQLFFEAYHGRYDAVISMYHDQGLGPFKMIAFHDGVNVTLGLPYVRTSPDHGTAFDIAYQGKADARSFASALSLAEKLVLRKP